MLKKLKLYKYNKVILNPENVNPENFKVDKITFTSHVLSLVIGIIGFIAGLASDVLAWFIFGIVFIGIYYFSKKIHFKFRLYLQKKMKMM